MTELNQKYFEHLAPQEFHPFFESFNEAYEDFLKLYPKEGLEWSLAGMAGEPVKVKVGDTAPVFNFIMIKHGPNAYKRITIPPEKLKKNFAIDIDSRVATGGKSIEMKDLGYLYLTPVFRFEIVKDPHLIATTSDPSSHLIATTSDPALIFTVNVNDLLTNSLKILLANNTGKAKKPPKYTLYEHVFGSENNYPDQGFFYVGITQRTWQKRWNEHKAAMNRGSKLKFHKTFREELRKGRVTYINHKVMAVVENIEDLYTVEEELIDGHWEDERLLNMIPGGRKGLKYLHEHNMIGPNVHPLPDHVDRLLENWFKKNPRKGLPAPWMTEKWEDDAFAESVICGADGRLKPDQVRAIRHLFATGLEPEAIVAKVGALNLPQVNRVITGQSYSRIS